LEPVVRMFAMESGHCILRQLRTRKKAPRAVVALMYPPSSERQASSWMAASSRCRALY
jgi:hypothetical protein